MQTRFTSSRRAGSELAGRGPASSSGSYTLRQAASVVFALTAVLPLLIFAWTLYSLEAIGKPQAQLRLGLALVLALCGFHIFRVMLGRMSDLIQSVGTVSDGDGVSGEPADARASVVAEAAARAARPVPGIGPIREFGEMAKAVDHLQSVWKAEAEPLVGRRVLVSVRNAAQPIAGVLVQVTDEGVLLDQDGKQAAISYRRISAIELDRTAAPVGSDGAPDRST